MRKTLLVEDELTEKQDLNFWISELEKYDRSRVVTGCLLAGTDEQTAEIIANKIDQIINKNMKMSEVRPLILTLLHRFDPAAATHFRTNETFVRTSDEKFECFDNIKIAKSIVKETEINEQIASEIAGDVEKFINRLNLNYISSPMIREIVCVKLLEHGLEEARKRYTRLGIPIYDVEQMINKGISTDIKRENANLQHTPETINWIISGETLEQYSLLRLLPGHLTDPHLSGDYHIHILSNIATRPNCIQHYPPLFFKHGLKADGTGRHTSVAGPPKHLSVAIQHCAKIMLASQTQMAGGQSIDCFNVWLAPFLKNLKVEEVKQAAQEFIYELNQCFEYSNPIILVDKNGEKISRIGEFIDSRLDGKEKAILDEKIFTYTLDDNLNFKKTKIIAVAKRKKRSNEQILEITTRHGRAIKVTENHPLFVFRDGLKVIPAKDISKEDVVLTFGKIVPSSNLNELNLIDMLIKNLNGNDISKIFVTGFKKLTDSISERIKISFADLARSVGVNEKDFWKWREVKRDSAPIKVVYNLINKFQSIKYDYLKVKYGAGSTVSLPAILKLDSELIRFLGYYVSEGHGVKDGNTIKIATTEKEIVDDLLKFSEKYKIKMCKVSDNDYNFNSKILHTLITRVFGCGTHAHKKRVPNFLFGASMHAKAEFLGAYLSGDGGFWDCWVGCTTVSEMLAHDLLLLFLNFEIAPSIHKQDKGIYRQQFVLGIFGKDNLDKFSEIGFTILRKRERLECYLNGFDDSLTRTSAIVPLSSDALDFIKDNKIFRYYNRNKLTNYNFENLIASGFKAKLCLLNKSVFWDVVKDVNACQTYSENVYDIETEDHSFLAGFGFGFLAHNSYVARGGQVVFSNVNFEFGIPDWLKEVPAVGPGGEVKGVYGDYEEDANNFLREYIKVKIKGDYVRKQHMFPNDTFKVRKDTFQKYPEEIKLVHEFIAKYGTPYIANGLPEWQTENFNYMGCLSADTPLPYVNDSSNHLSSIGSLAEKYFEKFGTKTYGFSIYTEPENLSVFSWNPKKNIIEKKKVLKIIKNPFADLFEIRTTKGKKIKVTKDHPFFRIARGKCWLKKAEQVDTKELHVGDRILVPVKMPLFEKKDNKIDAYSELLGFFIGDGTILNLGKGNPVVMFNFKADSDHLPYLQEVCKRLNLNLEIKKTYHSGDKVDYVNCYIKDKEICRKFVELYIGGKKIPDNVFNNSNSVLGFLAGIINSDGYVRTVKNSRTKTTEILITSTLENVANSVCLMLSSFGLDYSIRKQENPGKKCKKPAYRISLFGKNAEWILIKIPLASRHKKKEFSVKEFNSKETKSVKILSVNQLENDKPVYDLEVEDNHTFISGQGFFIHSNCRTRLDSKFAGPWGTQRTGNDLYITLNLPRIAYEARGNDDKFFEILQERLEKMAEILIIKHKITDDTLHKQNLLQFLSQKFDSEEYYQLMNTTKTFGYAGLTEAMKIHCGHHLHENDASQQFGIKIIKRINDYAAEMTKKTGLRFSVIASPAETCAARLAKLDITNYKDKAIFSGTKEAPYYTNSHMVKMDANVNFSEKVKIEEPYHPLSKGGHIMHVWLGENSPSAEALLDVTKKICNNTNIGFFAYTRDYSTCNQCNQFSYGLINQCTNCGQNDLSRYSRITGYYQQVEGWNPSKKQELKDRFRFSKVTINT